MKKPRACRELIVRRVGRQRLQIRNDRDKLVAQSLLAQATAAESSISEGDVSRERLVWLAQISTRHERQLQQLLRAEADAREQQARAESLAEFLHAIEGTWDPSKHPRGAFSQNRGWFSPTGGVDTAAGTSSAFDRIDQSTVHLTPQARAIAGSLPPHLPTQLQNADQRPNDMRNQMAQSSPNSDQRAGDETAHEPLSHNDLLTYFRILYGEKGRRLLNAFLRSGGRITVEGLWIGNSSLTWRDIWGPHRIRVDQGLNPAEAARELMERLLEATGLTEVRQQLDHSGFKNIDALIESYRQSVKKAAAFVSLASQLYLSGVSIVSEGADWVITIHELSEGNYQAAIGLLPLLPAIVGKTKIILKHGDETLRISAEAARGAKRVPVNTLIELLQSTQDLARNMVKAGIRRLPGTEAHHIVPSAIKGPSADKLRAILEKFGIDQHSAANGVFLPTTLNKTVRAEVHGYGLRSPAYCDALWSRLKKARSKQEVLIILDQIRNELLRGTFRY